MTNSSRHLRNPVLYAVVLLLLSAGCASFPQRELTREEAQRALADYYDVALENIRIVSFRSSDEGASVGHQVRGDHGWDPPLKGFYMAVVGKDKAGRYTVDIPKYEERASALGAGHG